MSTGRRWVAEVADGLLEFPTALCRLAQNYVAALSRRFKSFVNVRVAQTLDSHVVTLHREKHESLLRLRTGQGPKPLPFSGCRAVLS